MQKKKDYKIGDDVYRLYKRGWGQKELLKTLREEVDYNNRSMDVPFECNDFGNFISDYHKDFIKNGQRSNGVFRKTSNPYHVNGALMTYVKPANIWVSISLHNPCGDRKVRTTINNALRNLAKIHLYPSAVGCEVDGCGDIEELDVHHVSPTWHEMINPIVDKHIDDLTIKIDTYRFEGKKKEDIVYDSEAFRELTIAHKECIIKVLCQKHHKVATKEQRK